MSFSELVDRLPTEAYAKGRMFERLCRWYLQNAPEYRLRVRKVWLWEEWPGRWGPDCGIDLVAETFDDELWAVQAKAYDPAHTVTKTDVDSFLSESGRTQFSFRLVMATTDGIGANAYRALVSQEKPVGLLMRSHLDVADVEWPDDLASLHAPRRPAATPRPHQQVAIREVVEGFGKADRGQLIMACGTGKTLVSMWISEALRSERTLVLVPSLTLMSQTIHEWTANAGEPFDYLAVCSDETVTDRDAMVSHTADLGLPVTTDPAAVADFASRPGRRVVFATYQSSPRLADAHALGAPAFDLAVADEAHRCAGPATGDFATILADDRIRASKRLFMTATPRYFTNRIKQIAGEADFEVASMDEEHKFGPVLHRLTFGEAIRRDLLSDYIVLVVGVDEGTYRAYVERGELVTPDGRVITDARLLASHIGLAKAMRDYDLRRVVSFHGRVKRAEEFSSFFPEVVKWMPPDRGPSGTIWSDYASGEMSSGKRDALLSRLRNLDGGVRGLLSNARCLAEGVDVPALDGVAFIDPRGSRVEIIEAVGRAIRKSPEKKVGVIVLPVFIAGEDDPEQALNDSAFKNVWEVLKALRAHDEVLGEELDTLRRRLGVAKTADWKRPGKIVLDVPAWVGADFVRAFDVRLVESLTSSWEYWFAMLGQYAEREGHARVTRFQREDGIKLGQWVSSQREDYRAGKLDADHQHRLEEIPGWTWKPFDDKWEEAFAKLTQYAGREGHARVLRFQREDGIKLGLWVSRQRVDYRAGKLDADHQRRLEGLPGWTWDVLDADWENAFAKLTHYAGREGHGRVPSTYEEDGFNLGNWVGSQRVGYRAGKLDTDHQRRLEEIPGWTWHRRQASTRTPWEKVFAKLTQYAEREGHARVTRFVLEDGFKLGVWVSEQRRNKVKGKLDRDRQRRLEELPGWTWSAFTLSFTPSMKPRAKQALGWEEAFAKLRDYVDRAGDARVLRYHREDGFKLGQWVSDQRGRYKAGKLNADGQRRLEELSGWTWSVFTRQALGWEEAFAKLRHHVDRAGDARVPSVYVEEDGFKLGSWVSTQRRYRARGQLDADHQRRLEALPGWTWDARGSRDGATT
jgi:superfamily II DNA or RNA helicase